MRDHLVSTGPGAVDLAISHHARSGQIPLVRRPLDDEELSDIWKLPSTTLPSGKRPKAAIQGIGPGELGIHLRKLNLANQGTSAGRASSMWMGVFSSSSIRLRPRLTPPYRILSTVYVDWHWNLPSALETGTAFGSLCCYLYLGARR